jgi:nucleoside-diphosphate-sugar epimerase
MKHKKLMESLVLSSTGGLVLRLPQVVGAMGNPNTLSNFIHDRIVSGEHFTVWAHAERNLIDIDDLVAIGTILITEMDDRSAPVVSIAAMNSMHMTEIVKIFERVHGRSANYSIVDKGDPLKIDTKKAAEIGARLGIDLGDGYIERVIRKYYTPQ